MDRTGDPLSDVPAGEPRTDFMYRRPEAQQISGVTGLSWFGGGADPADRARGAGEVAVDSSWEATERAAESPVSGRTAGAVRPADGERARTPPDETLTASSGALTAGGSGRVSFGFTDEPISPNHPVTGSSSDTPTIGPGSAGASVEGSPASVVVPSGLTLPAVPPARPPGDDPAGTAETPWPAAGRQPADPGWAPSPPPAPEQTWPQSTSTASAWPPPPADDIGWPSSRGEPVEPVPPRRNAADLIDNPPPDRHEPVGGPPRRQSRVVTAGIAVLSAIVLVAGTIAGVAYFSGGDGRLDKVLELSTNPAPGHTVSAPLDNRSSASFELLAGANRVTVKIGELGDDLYRISTPDDAGIAPSPLIRQDDVKLQVTRDGDGTGGEIDIVLAAKVRWSVRIAGYVEQQLIDLSGGQVSGIEMVAGSRTAQLSLPEPSGTVPMKVNGAVDQLTLRSPTGNPVRVRVNAGAANVVAGSRTLRNVPAGSTLTPRNWKTTNRYDVTAGARITSLTVESA